MELKDVQNLIAKKEGDAVRGATSSSTQPTLVANVFPINDRAGLSHKADAAAAASATSPEDSPSKRAKTEQVTA